MITFNELSQKKIASIEASRNLVIDNYSLPFAPGQLTLLGACTGMGRTLFMLHLYAELFTKYRQSMLFVSNEEKEQPLYLKMASLLAGQYFYSDTQVPDKLFAQCEVLSSEKCKVLWFDNNWEKLKSQLDQWGKENRNGFLFIDKIQGLYIRPGYKNRNSELRIIIRELKRWAVEFHISVIVSSTIKKGNIFDFKLSSPFSKLFNISIWKEFADLVMLLQRPIVNGIYLDDEGNNIRCLANLYIAKNQSGPIQTLNIYFDQRKPGFKPYNKLERMRMANPAFGVLVNRFGLVDEDQPF
jgi:replicative DNA helicase